MNEIHQFEPYTLTSFDHSFPPAFYHFVALSFAIQKPQDAIPTLKSAILRVVDQLPFLTGEVGPCPDATKKNVMQVQPSPTTTHETSIVQVKEHPQFVLSSTPTPEKGTGAGQHHARCVDLPGAIVPEFDYSSIPAPVFRAQINILADGIVLCLAINHMVIDGTGTGALIDVLATACRGGEGSVDYLRRCDAIQKSTRRYLQDLGTQGRLPDGVHSGNDPTDVAGDIFEPGKSYANHTLVFSDTQIKALKARCNAILAEMFPAASTGPANTETTVRDQRSLVSSNDVLTALLWMSINQVKLKPTQPREESFVSVPVNTRTRFSPSLPDNYLGNAVLVTESKLALSELQCLNDDGHLGETSTQSIRLLSLLAHRVRSSITTVDDESLRVSLRRAHHASDWETLLARPGDVVVSSLRLWNSFSLDFGPILGGLAALELVPKFA
ncbi:transferase family-domain-containing protein [Aspergillus candidus]|uniref:Transferase family-domain-containing protein n=1 Tax=Aspergillus candidus TaxID=41067 RepID=A0A2I2FAJ4_ASPCN|nr:transferase family-domain-containing protein [Aspergillus candidus]PLB37645.1 transferase family-domain-containing protein [Aspergillus candidus]